MGVLGYAAVAAPREAREGALVGALAAGREVVG